MKAIITRKIKKVKEKINVTTNQKPRPKEVEESHQAGGDDWKPFCGASPQWIEKKHPYWFWSFIIKLN